MGLVKYLSLGMSDCNIFHHCCFLFLNQVCNKMTKYRPISPYLCMDMTYITCLLKDGFGFKDSTVLQVSGSVVHLGNILWERM